MPKVKAKIVEGSITENTRCVAIFKGKGKGKRPNLDRVDFYLWCMVRRGSSVLPSPLILMDDGSYDAAVNIPGYLRPVEIDATAALIKRECASILDPSEPDDDDDELDEEEEDPEEEDEEDEDDDEDPDADDGEEPAAHVRVRR